MTFAESETEQLRKLPLEERLTAIRSRLRLTQEELAGRVGRSLRTVNRWESPHFHEAPNRTSRQALAEATGLPERLFLRAPPSRGQLEQTEATLSQEIEAQLREQRQILADIVGAVGNLDATVRDLRELVVEVRLFFGEGPQQGKRPA